MAQQGTVTITAKVNASQAEAALKSLGGVASRVAVDHQRSSEIQRRATQETIRLYDTQAKAATQVAELRRRMEDQIARSTMTSIDYRIHAIKREAQETDKLIRQMAISRKQQEELIYKNVAAMEAQITAVMKAEAEKRKQIGPVAASGAGATPSAEGGGLTILAGLRGPALGVAAGVTAATLAVGKMTEMLRPAVQAAAEYEASMKTLQTISDRTGGSFLDAKNLVGELSDEMTSSGSLAKAIGIFQTMNLSMEDQKTLITAMRDGLSGMSMDVNEQLPLMALALKRQEGALLDNMGVTRTLEMMWKEYAVTIGKTTDALTQAEREQAVINGVLKDLEKYAGAAAGSMDIYKGSVNAVNTAHRKFAEEAGAVVTPAMGTLNRWWASNVTQAAEFIGKLREMRANWVQSIRTMEAHNRGEALPFGPAFGAEGDQRFKEAQGKAAADAAKAAEEAATKQREAAQKRAEEAKKERERREKQIADDRRKLEESLFKDLALVGKQGWDLQLAQEQLAHAERLRMAHGDHKLRESAERLHIANIAEIRKKLSQYSTPIGPGLANSPSQYDAPIGPGLNDGIDIDKIRASQEALRSGIASGIQVGVDGGLPSLQSSFETASRTALTKGIVTAIEGSPAMGAMGQLGAAFANPFVAAFGIAFTAGLNQFLQERQNWETLRDRYITKESERPQWERDLDSVNEKRAGIETRIGQLDQIIEDERAHFIDRQHAESERNSLLQQITKTEELTAAINQKAAEDQRKAAEDQMRAAGEMGRVYHDQLNELMRQANQSTRLRVAEQQGPESVEQVRKEIEAENYRHGALEDIRSAGVALAGSFGNLDNMREMFGHDLVAALQDGILDPTEKLDFTKYFGEQRDAGFQELDKLAAIFQQMLANDPASRVLPGSSPQNPGYQVIVNLKDMWAFMPKDAFFRAGGPGTRRDDGGSGRGINVGGRR